MQTYLRRIAPSASGSRGKEPSSPTGDTTNGNLWSPQCPNGSTPLAPVSPTFTICCRPWVACPTYLTDLGLYRRSSQGGLVVANPIYREVLPRVLSQTPEASLPQIGPSWLTPAGTLAPDKLLTAFLSFWRQHGQPLLKSAPYHEIAPHLVLMTFLHRVINGGGTLEWE